jgi:Protein of unknown function (DUF3761)
VLRSRHWILATAIAVATIGTGSLQAQAAATICKDGTTSVSSGRGACSGHGGVNKKAATHQKKVVKSEVKAATAVAKRTPGTQVTTLCADGTTSNSTGRGTCSGHGGARGAEATSKTTGEPVRAPGTATEPRASARASARANSKSAVVSGSGAGEDNNPAGAIARCKDGMYSHARNRRGACSRHGGVASWL